jgi:hypothetical protein
LIQTFYNLNATARSELEGIDILTPLPLPLLFVVDGLTPSRRNVQVDGRLIYGTFQGFRYAYAEVSILALHFLLVSLMRFEV